MADHRVDPANAPRPVVLPELRDFRGPGVHPRADYGGGERRGGQPEPEVNLRELDALDPVKVRKLEDLLEQEFRQMVSVYLKHYLVPAAHRNALQKPLCF